MKMEEERIRKALESANVDFKREHNVSFKCWGGTWSSADFLVVERGCVLIVEVDETQHMGVGYTISCDMRRMGQMHQAFLMEGNTLPVAFVRYNPHAFKVDGETQRTTKEDREAQLLEVLKGWQPGPPGSLQILYMFYNCRQTEQGLRLDIWDDPEYDTTMQQCCLPPIV